MLTNQDTFKVLLIEDDATIQSAFTEILSRKKIDVIEATTLAMGWNKFLQNQDVDAIFMDGCVPGSVLNTLPLIKEIRGTGFTGPIIAASSRSDYRNAQVEAGCSHHCEKNDALHLIIAWRDDTAKHAAAHAQSLRMMLTYTNASSGNELAL